MSQTSKLFLIISVFPLRDRLDFVHQVADNRTVTYQFSYPLETNALPSFVHNFVWKFRLFTYTARIVVFVFYKLKLKLKTQQSFYIYDGPGIFSKMLTQNSSTILPSSNQVYCVLYSLEDFSEYIPETELLDFYAFPTDVIQVRLVDNDPVILPPCNAELNFHCVYNITSTSGYINLSVSELTVNGFDWNSNYYDCFLGGVAFTFDVNRLDSSYRESERTYSVKKRSDLYDMRYLCDNYTSKYDMKSMFDKSLMDLVSNTRDGMLLAVYSYKHYSRVTMAATVTVTPCRGDLYYKPAGDKKCKNSRPFRALLII